MAMIFVYHPIKQLVELLIAVVGSGVEAHACILIFHARKNTKLEWHILLTLMILILVPDVLCEVARQRRVRVGQEELVVVDEVGVLLVLGDV